MLNLTPDSDLGRKTVPETCVRFDATFAKVGLIMSQIWTKYDQFLTQYPSRPFHPITAVSAGHQSKSCSVYEKCEDIFFPEIIFLELNMFYKKAQKR